MSVSGSRPAGTRLSLLALVAGLVWFELVFNRVTGRLIRVELLSPQSGLYRALDFLGLFSFHFLSVLAVVTLAVGLIDAVVRPRLRTAARLSLPLMGSIFVSLALAGVFVRLPSQLFIHLHLSFIFLCLLLTLTTVSIPAPRGLRLGAVLWLLPIVMHFAALLARRLTPEGDLAPTPRHLQTIAEWCAVVAALTSALCFAPPARPLKRSHRWMPIAISALVVGVLLALLYRDWEMIARLALNGFGIDLPLTRHGQLVHIIALGVYVTAVVRLLLLGPGPARLRAYGLLLLGGGGLLLELPYQLSVAALGVLCWTMAAAREASQPITREVFEQLVKVAAASIGSLEVTVTGNEGDETARMQTPADATPKVVVSIAREAGAIARFEVVAGELPPRDPPFALARRGAEGLGPRGDGNLVRTDDAAFDAEFVHRLKRGDTSHVLDDANRHDLAAVAHGWLGVWPQRGVCYRARRIVESDDGVARLLRVLVDVARRTA